MKRFQAGYLLYYYRMIGPKLLAYFVLCLVVGVLDGFGLAMFIPLLQRYSPDATASEATSDPNFIDRFLGMIQGLGVDINFQVIILIIMVIFLAKGVIKFFQLRFHVYLRTQFIYKVRSSIVNQVAALAYRGFHTLDMGTLQNVSTLEVNKLYQSFQYYFLTAQNVILLITYSFLAFLANYRFSLAVAVAAILINFLFRFFYTRSKKISYEISQNNNRYNTLFLELLQNFKYLKSTGFSGFYRGRIHETIEEENRQQSKIGFYSAFVTGLKEPVIVVMVMSIILFEVTVFDTKIETIVVSVLLFYRALTTLGGMQNYWQSFITNTGAFANLNETMDYLKKNEDRPSGTVKTDSFQSMEFADVSYESGDRKILDHVNFKLERNKMYAFTGPSGSGKTTIVNMLTSLLGPTSGVVRVNGTDVNDLDMAHWRSRIGIVTQEVVIFNDTLYNNITLWDAKTPENRERFDRAITLASLGEFFAGKGNDTEAMLGLNGSAISGGQRQRIAIARELYKKIDVLIFDEATSALDVENENIIQSTIERIKDNMTIVVVTHKLTSLRQADTVLLVDGGTVINSGSYERLLAEDPAFTKMVRNFS
jgi:ABC-type multidrug transport system fused ATPase/permease subunit